MVLVRTVLLIVVTFTSFGYQTLQPKSNAINFQEMGLDEAITIAKKANKPIFIDVYTDWCGPCIQMKKNTFTDAAVIEYFNKNFINIACNAEDVKGKILAINFRVVEYPTLLFLNHDGQLLQRAIGYYSPKLLLDLANDVSSNSRKN